MDVLGEGGGRWIRVFCRKRSALHQRWLGKYLVCALQCIPVHDVLASYFKEMVSLVRSQSVILLQNILRLVDKTCTSFGLPKSLLSFLMESLTASLVSHNRYLRNFLGMYTVVWCGRVCVYVCVCVCVCVCVFVSSSTRRVT